MSPERRPCVILVLFGLLTIAGRYPLAPGQLIRAWTDLPAESGSQTAGDYEAAW